MPARKNYCLLCHDHSFLSLSLSHTHLIALTPLSLPSPPLSSQKRYLKRGEDALNLSSKFIDLFLKFNFIHFSLYLSVKMAARFVWEKNGPKPVSKKNLQESCWLVKSTVCTPNNLEVNFTAGSREFGLNAEQIDGKISESALKRRYS